MNFNEAIDKLKEIISIPQHIYQPSLMIFNNIDTELIAKEYELERLGKERGERNEPPIGSSSFDTVENKIVNFITEERKIAYNEYLNNQHVYQNRINSLDFENRASAIESAISSALSEFVIEAQKGDNNLYLKEIELKKRLNDLNAFKESNRLLRELHRPTNNQRLTTYAMISFLFIVELIVNGSFFREGSTGGWLGGVIEALIISILNIGFCSVFGYLWIRYINHVGSIKRIIGYLSILITILFIGIFNFAVAHYRESIITNQINPGTETISSLLKEPLHFDQFQSWVLIGIGIISCIIAVYKTYKLDDPYPNYSKFYDYYKDAYDSYGAESAEVMDRIFQIKENALEAIDMASNDLLKRKHELANIIDSFSKLKLAYKNHIKQLEIVCNSLLSKYRDANRSARERSPRRFNEEWNFDSEYTKTDELIVHEDLINELLSKTINIVGNNKHYIADEYNKHINSIKQIRELLS